MCNNNKKTLNQSDILYVNRLTNVVYQDGEILETNVHKSKKATHIETIFDIFARILTRCGEERKILWHIIFDKEEYNKIKLADMLEKLYDKSSRTYLRSINEMIKRRIIIQSKHKVLKVPIEYDLSLLDLDNVKSIIIHIN